MPWSIWVVSPQGAHPLPLLEPGELCFGSEATGRMRVVGEGVAPEHVRFHVTAEGGLEAEALAPLLLNDFQLSGRSALKGGDELRLGAVRLLVVTVRASASPRPLLRREYEALRQGVFLAGGPASLIFARVPSIKTRVELLASWIATLPASARCSELGPSTLEVLLPGAGAETRRACAAALMAAGAERVEGASRLQDGETLDEVLEKGLGRYLSLTPEAPEEASFTDPVMLRLLSALEHAPTASWVLLGERGVGRELLARAAHLRRGATGPFVVVRSPPLFAPVEDADARAVREAAAEAASGTLFLDLMGRTASMGRAAGHGIGEAAWTMLRERTRDARAVFFSLSSAPDAAEWVLTVPPLRDRPADILPLAESMLARSSRAAGRPPLVFSRSARELLMEWTYPGNVRELKNAVVAAVLTSAGQEITPESLPWALQQGVSAGRPPESLRTALDETEREALLATLARTRWNVTRAAQALGIPRRTVVYRMARLGLRRPERE